jgi:tetratricopeptide (TPR) repeat protein
VIARTSVLRYKDAEVPIGQIGEELGVDYILEGTVRWQHAEGEQARVRVTPQLIKVSDATHVWADVFDEPLTAVFEVQSDIAGRVIDELNVTLVGTPGAVEPPTDNLEAYDHYLRGMSLARSEVTPTSHQEARRELIRAIELDPEFAEAHAALSMVHSDLYWYFTHSEEHKRRALEYAERALELRPRSASAHMAMGMYRYHCELDYDRALEQFDIALRIRPNDAQLIAAIGFVNRRKGNWDGAVEHIKRASRLDPQFFLYHYELAETLVDLRRLDEAEWYMNKAIELNPSPDICVWKIVIELMRGDMDAAYAVVDSCPDASKKWILETKSGWLDVIARKYESALAGLEAAAYDADESHFAFIPRTTQIAYVYWMMGRPEQARVYADSSRVLVESRLAEAPRDSRLLSAAGIAYALMGEKDRALEAARKAVELMPVSKEAKQGPFRLRDLTQVLIIVGEYDEAIDHIEYLLSLPAGFFTPPFLRMSSDFDPLRDQPRFQSLLAGA